MGSPEPPSAAQYRALEAASPLAPFDAPAKLDITEGRDDQITLPRQAVSLFVIEW